ncbi:MAG TPA: SCO family protein [Chitinivibrionales bacterium]|nr:SCO family protein [Chitinivibrionales bacterium]
MSRSMIMIRIIKFYLRRCAVCSFLVVIAATLCPLFAHGGHSHKPDLRQGAAIDSIALLPAAADTVTSGAMGMDEKPGALVPLDIPFVTQTGDTIRLRDIVKGPTILSLLYYKCPDACSTLLTSIANVLRPFTDKPGTAPNVITISIDENETPADAMKARTIAFEAVQKPYPAQRWHFLTGPAESIKKVTAAVGFRYVKKGNEFDHPLGLIILSPQGKVTRYILGTDFLPMDITMSLMEASNGTVQPTIARVLRACFSYDPKSHRFVFKILQVSATVILTLLGIFVAYLIASGRKRKQLEPRR